LAAPQQLSERGRDMTSTRSSSLIPAERIERSILFIRGQKVMLDADLASLYEVETRVLLQAIRRNQDRFPKDFMLQLTKEELENWRSHFVTSNPTAKMGLRRRPYVFTEQGVAMLSSVLNSKRAIHINIEIIRAFVRLRQLIAGNKELARKLEHLGRTVASHDQDIKALLLIVDNLLTSDQGTEQQREIGFLADPNRDKK